MKTKDQTQGYLDPEPFPGYNYTMAMSKTGNGQFDIRAWTCIEVFLVEVIEEPPIRRELFTQDVMAWLDEKNIPVIIVPPSVDDQEIVPHRLYFWFDSDAVHFKLRWYEGIKL